VLGRSQTSYFVANHFAVLDKGNIDLTQGLTYEGKPWLAFSSFVRAQFNDFPPPFVNRILDRISTHQALITIRQHHTITSSNSEQRGSQAGLEALSLVAADLALHRNGLADLDSGAPPNPGI
jgi:hypothetical protein